MPAIYAHRVFGREVLATLSPLTLALIEKNPHLFQMGLHGPDLLFYYKPLKSTPLGKLGYTLHRHNGREVIAPLLEAVKALPDDQQDAGLSYTLGFVCHYLLDSACHPYVEQLVKAQKANHCMIEGEFDLWLITREELEPLKTDPVSHLAGLGEGDFAVIAHLFGALSKIDTPEHPPKSRPKQIASAHRTMQLLSHIFASKHALVRALARIGFFVTGTYEERQGMIYQKAPDPSFEGCSAYLWDLLSQTAKEAPIRLEEVMRHHLGKRFDHSFDG